MEASAARALRLAEETRARARASLDVLNTNLPAPLQAKQAPTERPDQPRKTPEPPHFLQFSTNVGASIEAAASRMRTNSGAAGISRAVAGAEPSRSDRSSFRSVFIRTSVGP